MSASHPPTPIELRHRLLEGVLLRLGRLVDAEHFVLRGGMLLRHWFKPLARAAGDLDLAATDPHDVSETARRLVPLLADRGVADGVVFDAERFRVDGIWPGTAFPGVRMFGTGTVDGVRDRFSLDVTFGEELVPTPVWGDYLTASGAVARLRMCRPETIAGRKLHALKHLGALHWRPKDLNDLRLLLRRVPMNPDVLAAAIASSFTSRGDTTADARTLFRCRWWELKTSQARWQAFITQGEGPETIGPLAGVVGEVAASLKPILEHLR
jgi:hypothetical protein